MPPYLQKNRDTYYIREHNPNNHNRNPILFKIGKVSEDEAKHEFERFKQPRIQLYCKDCFEVFPTLENGSIDLILADLPYGTTQCEWDSILSLDKLWIEYKRILKKKGIIVLTASQPFTWKLCASNPEWFKYEIIWEKPNGTNPLLVKVQPFKVHENILVFHNGGQPTYNPQKTFGHGEYAGFEDNTKSIGTVFTGNKEDRRGLVSRHARNTDGSRYPRSVQRFAQDRSGHPTKKPTALMEWLVRTYTNPNETVLDNVMGEGTTGVACVRTQRRFIGIELNPAYFTIAKRNIDMEIERCTKETSI